MRSVLLCCALVLLFGLRTAAASETRTIELTDGTTLTGEVTSLSDGIYTIKSESLGTICIEESKVRAILAPPQAPAAAGSEVHSLGEVHSLQEKMMSDGEIMDMIRSLRDDPEFKKVLEDPAIMKAVEAGDIAALTASPAVMKLLDNAKVREIGRKVR